jgi:hypothetical protein
MVKLLRRGLIKSTVLSNKLPDKDFLVENKAINENFKPKMLHTETKVEGIDLGKKIDLVWDALEKKPKFQIQNLIRISKSYNNFTHGEA